MKEIFLLDANSFITPYRQYYAFDILPTYWNELSKQVSSQRLVILDKVQDELNNGEDDLSKWLNEQTNFIVCNHVSKDIIDKYQEIMQYIYNWGFYTDRAFHNWSLPSIADPWLIAAAAVNKYTIITNEVSAGILSHKNQSRNAKIPDVAKEFGVKTGNLFYMMRELGIKI